MMHVTPSKHQALKATCASVVTSREPILKDTADDAVEMIPMHTKPWTAQIVCTAFVRGYIPSTRGGGSLYLSMDAMLLGRMLQIS